ncbi:hypothetical protein RRG08_011405 [Elysia crispata]|uniref:Uncharacterized protein n=1 Tax=Elysia crispata TaxID=231223 RepID=A0AAE0Z748_9GAST|nr:hypothetical protein RRG08_011405 [Elysia crispata]
MAKYNESQQVSCPELNDSKWIGVRIYHVVVLCPLAVVVVMATENSPDTNALETSSSILVTTMIQCLIFFFPKVRNGCRTAKSKLHTEDRLYCLDQSINEQIIAYRKYTEAHSSQSNLALHNGSLTFSRHSDTPSTSTRSIMTCEFPSQLAYGDPVNLYVEIWLPSITKLFCLV